MMQVVVVLERIATGSRLSLPVDVPKAIMLATDGSIESRAEARLMAVESACDSMLQDGWELITFRTA